MYSTNDNLVSELKAAHPRFQSLCEKHDQLDKQIMVLEGPSGAGYNLQVMKLKKKNFI